MYLQNHCSIGFLIILLAVFQFSTAEITSLITVVNLSDTNVTIDFTNQEWECISRDFDSSNTRAYLDSYRSTNDGAFGTFKDTTGVTDLEGNLWGFADSHVLPPGQPYNGSFQTYWAAMDNAPGCLTAQSNQWFVLTTPNDTYACTSTLIFNCHFFVLCVLAQIDTKKLTTTANVLICNCAWLICA